MPILTKEDRDIIVLTSAIRGGIKCVAGHVGWEVIGNHWAYDALPNVISTWRQGMRVV